MSENNTEKSQEPSATNVTQFLDDLNGGVLMQKLGHVLSSVASGVVAHGKAGKVTVTFDMARIGENAQVMVKHKLAFVKPTTRGKAREEDSTETPMFVNMRGKMSIHNEHQRDLDLGKGITPMSRQSAN